MNRRQIEAQAKRLLSYDLRELNRALVAHDNAAASFARGFVSQSPSKASTVLACLLARLSDELRAIQWAAAHGYLFPMMSLSASCFEFAYTIAFVGHSEVHAATWLEHTLLKQVPWKPYELVEAVKGSSTKVPGSPASLAYGHYTNFCAGKHHNPKLVAQLPYATTGEQHLIEIDPQIAPHRSLSIQLIGLLVLLDVSDCLALLHPPDAEASSQLAICFEAREALGSILATRCLPRKSD